MIRYLFAMVFTFVTAAWFSTCSDEVGSSKPENSADQVDGEDDLEDGEDGSPNPDADGSDSTSDAQADASDANGDDDTVDAPEAETPVVVITWDPSDDPAVTTYELYLHATAEAEGEEFRTFSKASPEFDLTAPAASIKIDDEDGLLAYSGTEICFSIVAIRYGEASEAAEMQCVEIP